MTIEEMLSETPPTAEAVLDEVKASAETAAAAEPEIELTELEQQQQMVAPQPLPEIWNFRSDMVNGQPAVIVTIQKLNGIAIHFMEREFALDVARNLKTTAETGPQLAVPPPSKLIVPR